MYDKEGLGVKTVTYMDNQDCIGEDVHAEKSKLKCEIQNEPLDSKGGQNMT